MKTIINIQTESGITLTSPDEGIIVLGCIFKSKIDKNNTPVGGLIGCSSTAEKLLSLKITPTAYTNKEFIRNLIIDPYELSRISAELLKETQNKK